RPANVEIARGLLQEHDRRERPEPLALLHVRVDPVANGAVARIPDDAAVAERARAELAAPLVQRDDARVEQLVDEAPGQVFGPLDDEVRRALERRFEGAVARLRSEEIVAPAPSAALAEQLAEAVDRATESGARIARRGRNEDPIERRLAQQPVVR